MKTVCKALFSALLTVLILGVSVSPQAEDAEVDSGFKEIELFTEVLETIRQGYVDADKVTYEKLINSALEGMLADLDPHCQFMQPKVFEQLQRHTDLSLIHI